MRRREIRRQKRDNKRVPDLIQDVVHAIGRIGDVHRGIGQTGLRSGDKAHEHERRLVAVNHHGLALWRPFGKGSGKRVGPGVQLGVSQALARILLYPRIEKRLFLRILSAHFP